MKYIKIPFIIFCALIFSNCSKSSHCKYDSLPNSLFFQIKKNGIRLSDDELKYTKISYQEDNKTLYLNDIGRATDQAYPYGILNTRIIGIRSGNENIKNYTLELPDGSKYPLFVDYEGPDSRKDHCYYELKQVKFNGEIAVTDPQFQFQPIYIFNLP